MLSVVTWYWKPKADYRSTFGPDKVNRLFAMVRRHYPLALRCICVTNHPEGIDADIQTVPDWGDFADLPALSKRGDPSCYRRLRAFRPDIAEIFGERFVVLDLDWVIVGDLTPLWVRTERCVLLRDPRHVQYNGSMLLLRAGSRPQVWTDFHGRRSQAQAAVKYRGSDQAWISHCLWPREPMWTKRDGILSFWHNREAREDVLPKGTRMVSFCGANGDPWSPAAQRFAWVRQHYGEMERAA